MCVMHHKDVAIHIAFAPAVKERQGQFISKVKQIIL